MPSLKFIFVFGFAICHFALSHAAELPERALSERYLTITSANGWMNIADLEKKSREAVNKKISGLTVSAIPTFHFDPTNSESFLRVQYSMAGDAGAWIASFDRKLKIAQVQKSTDLLRTPREQFTTNTTSGLPFGENSIFVRRQGQLQKLAELDREVRSILEKKFRDDANPFDNNARSSFTFRSDRQDQFLTVFYQSAELGRFTWTVTLDRDINIINIGLGAEF